MSRALALCALLLAVTPRIAAAEWHFTPMVGLTFRGKTSGFPEWEIGATGKMHKQFGGAVSLIRVGTIGVEAVFIDTPRFFDLAGTDLVTESRSIALLGNVIVTAPRQWTEYTMRPYVSGGIGLMRINEVTRAFELRENLTGFNVGGGAIGFFSKRTGVRFDLRYFSTLRPVGESQFSTPDHRVRYMTASVGLVIRR